MSETDQLMSHSQTCSTPMRTPTVHQYMERLLIASWSFRASALYVAKDGRRKANQALERKVYKHVAAPREKGVCVPHEVED